MRHPLEYPTNLYVFKEKIMSKNYKELILEQRIRIRDEGAFGVATEDVPTLLPEDRRGIWGSAPKILRPTHPRLMFTEAEIPGIRKALEDDIPTNRLFKEYLAEDFDGILPNTTPSTMKRTHISRFSRTAERARTTTTTSRSSSARSRHWATSSTVTRITDITRSTRSRTIYPRWTSRACPLTSIAPSVT